MLSATRVKRCLLFVATALFVLLGVYGITPGSASAEGLKYPQRDEVKRMWNHLLELGENMKPYDVEPSIKAPYTTGKVSQAMLEQALLAANLARSLAGLPADLQLDAGLTDLAQHGAVLLAANNTLTHYPAKPADMADAFYQKGSESTSSSNISSGRTNLSQNVLNGYMPDTGSNADRVGHRRWILNPGLQKVGFGLAGSYGTMQVFDRSRTEAVDYSSIAWPAAEFPQQLFQGNYPWSVTLNPKKYKQPSLQDIQVQVTQVQTQKKWSLNAKNNNLNKDLYLNVELSGYGVPNAIIFRLDQVQNYEGLYQVSITGLHTVDGKDANLTYEVEFYDLSKHFYPGEIERWTLQFQTEQAWDYQTRTGIHYFDDYERPFVEKGTTLVPLRLVSEALGLTVRWDQASKSIIIQNSKSTIVLKEQDRRVRVDGKEVTVATAPRVIQGVTFVPLRFVSEQLGLSVNYNPINKNVLISRESIH